MKAFPFIFLVPLPAIASAGESTNYSNNATFESAGGRSASAVYSQTAACGVESAATASAGPDKMRHGFIGQLYDVVDVHFTPPSGSVAELDRFQLSPLAGLDDGTALTGESLFTYFADSGGFTSVSATGMITASAVPSVITAPLTVSYAGYSGVFNLFIADTIPDNYRGYAGDGLSDEWQATYWGLAGTNPDAEPGKDPDGDGQDNKFEYLAANSPLDRLSKLFVNVALESGSGKVSYGPLREGPTYRVFFSDSLASGSWQPLGGPLSSGSDGYHTETDPTPSVSGKRFYRVDVDRP